ncbi:MAG: pentapeptide repeat-containing protein [Longimicrobiales bacterium]
MSDLQDDASPVHAPSPVSRVESVQDGEAVPSVGLVESLQAAGRGSPHSEKLQGADLAGANLEGLDLSGLDLSGADLTGANLRRATMVGTNLAGATLDHADLQGAELLGATLKGADLSDVDGTNAGFGGSDASGADFFNAKLEGATFTRGTLVGADFRAAVLRGVRLREADLEDANLDRADLRDADLESSRLAGANFQGARLQGARLTNVDGYGEANWVGAEIAGTDFTGAYRVRRTIMDENFLHEFRTSGSLNSKLYWLWWATSDCGRSMGRWSLFTLLLTLAFAGLYSLVDLDLGSYPTRISYLYYSVVTLTTLGYGDVLPASGPAQLLAMIQVLIGYVMLGGLISILSTKMARRAD